MPSTLSKRCNGQDKLRVLQKTKILLEFDTNMGRYRTTPANAAADN